MLASIYQHTDSGVTEFLFFPPFLFSPSFIVLLGFYILCTALQFFFSFDTEYGETV